MFDKTIAPSGAEVSLAQMLARRESRYTSQQVLLRRFDRPLVQLTLVNPGAVKDTPQSHFVFDTGLGAMQEALVAGGHTVLAYEGAYFVTGAEMLMAVNAQALTVKRTLLALEEHHPLGRLWDVDVIDTTGAVVARRQLDVPPRRCLLCDESAHACARSRAHPLLDLQRAIQDKIHAFRQHTVQ